MANCPNINLDSWKDLVETRGEDMAYYLWDKHEGSVPKEEYTSNIKPAVEEVFNSTSELASIGTPQQYSQYVSNVFPESKVKDIVYHSSPNKIEKFRDSLFGTYFSYSPIEGAYGDNVYSVILNVENPLVKPNREDSSEVKEVYNKDYRNYNNPISFSPEGVGEYKYDASIETSTVAKEGVQIKVRNPEQIHILGSKEDIEGFKNYVTEEKKGMLQLEGTEGSTASPKTVAAIKNFLKQIGVDIKAGKEIVVNGVRMDANAVAMVTQKLIQVVEGAEAKALPEEAMHFAVEIIKQTNPKLYQQLLKEVGSYALTNQVFADYSKNPLYQTKDGKPDVIKLKEEAMGKILAETVIRNNEGLTEKPELLAKAESWWQSIINWFKNLIAKSGFDSLAMDIISGKSIGTAEDIKAEEGKAFLQQTQNAQDRVINKIKDVQSKIEKRPDGYYVDGKKVNKRVTQVVDDNWYSRKFKNNDLTKSEYEKAVDDQKAEKGTAGHADFEHALDIFLNPDGTLKSSDELDQAILDDDGYVSQINPNDNSMYRIIRDNLRERLESINNAEPGTKFLSEVTVYNPNAYGGLAGTIDFLSVSPNGKINILDWKFMAINTDKYSDVPWYKVGAWQEQMKNYKLILQNAYGVKSEDFGMTRMIPIQAIYSEGNYKTNVLPQLLNIRIGDVNVKNIKDDYLLPVGLEDEKTGNKKIDKLLEKLNAEYKRLSEKSVTPAEKQEKADALNALYTAIRQLKVRQNLQPIVRQAKLLNKQIQKTIDKYKDTFQGKSPKDFSEKERNAFAKEIEVAQDMINVYTKIDTELDSFFNSQSSEEDKKLRDDLRDVASDARKLEADLEETLNEYSENILAKSEGIEKFLSPEKVIKGITKMFASTATLQTKAIEFIYKKANRALAYMGMDTLTENKRLLKIKEKYDAWARRKGLSNKDYFNLIKKKDSNELVDEFNPEFYTTLKSKIAQKDFSWIRDNIDVAAYNAKLKEILAEELERIDNKARIGTDEEIAAEIKREKYKAAQLYNTSTTESPGWLLYDNINKFPKRDVWESKEWKELNKPENAPAKEFYNYIIERNNEYKELGYIGKGEARVFLPFVRKGLVEKMVFGGKVTIGEQFLRSISIDEGDIGYGKIDPLSGKPINTIPKYFTSPIDGEVSTDLFKTMGLYNEMALKYKYLSEVEDQIRAIVRVEKNKQAIRTSLFGKTQYKNDGELEYTPDNSDNAKLAEDMMKAIVYGQRYLESETFDQIIGKVGNWGKVLNKKLGVSWFPEDLSNRQLSVNKMIHSLNTHFQLSTLGFNLLSATSNFFGGNAQSIINAGKYFTKSDYIASEGELIINKLTNNKDRQKIIAAIEYFLPYTDNNTSKELLKKLSISKVSQENFQDALMILMRNSDLNVQTVNFMSFLKNSIVENGEILNAREYLRSQDKYANRYDGTSEQRKKLDEEFEKDVKELIEQKGVLKVAELVDGELVIPGVERKSDSVVKLRRQVQQLTKDALGSLSEDDRRMIDMTVYGKSFMIFKGWIPRLVDVRMGNLKYNAASDAYEWGRMRMVMRLITSDLSRSLSSLTNSIAGNDQKWVDQMKDLYEVKRQEYKKDTGKDLNMTQEQFMDLVRQNVRNQMLDTMFLLSMLSLVLALKALAPDDEDPVVKNQYKFMVKAADKLKDEIYYFYDLTSFSSLFSSGIFPSLSLIDNFKKGMWNFMKENYALAIGDEEMEEDNKVIKYWMRTFPVTNQIVGYLPLMYPDLAKDLGIKVQSDYGIR